MSTSVRNIDQQFWINPLIPHLTVRRTANSTQGYKEHSHNELSIGIIESGSTCLTLQGRQIILSKGDTILIAPDVVHACNPIAEGSRSYYMLYVDKQWCCNVLSTLFERHVEQFVIEQELVSDPKSSATLAELLFKLIEDESPNTITAVNALLLTLVSRFCTPCDIDTESDELAQTIQNRLLEDITEPPSIQEIAEDVSRPAESLIRGFKKRFGITPKSFLNNHRIEKAKLLLKSGMSIVDVAHEVGFSDQSQFHKAFVAYTASTPRQYQSTSVNFRQ
ncbi:AraC family transcriptional regulator [Vibrio sp. HN007]|uniref:AraC family transcriptional regulator n=1 Tax=Vibrio iocasae TaxID=3098914 RepID=UPI0035D4E35A